MKYQLKIESRAKKDLQSLDPVIQRRIIKKLKFFLAQPDPLEYAKKLTDNICGDYRWRIGHYRAAFDVEEGVIKLLRVKHRREVYR